MIKCNDFTTVKYGNIAVKVLLRDLIQWKKLLITFKYYWWQFE